MELKNLINVLYLFILLLCISCQNKPEQEIERGKHFTIQIKGMDYDSLFVRDWNLTANSNEHRFLIKGDRIDSITWDFQIPDSIYNTTASFEILPKPFDWSTNTTYRISFDADINGKKLYSHQLTFDDNHPSMVMQYKECIITDSIYLATKTVEGKDTSVIGRYHMTKFEVQPIKGSELYLRMLDPSYGVFLGKDDTTSYEGYMDEYITLAKQYPDSKFLISQLASHLYQYKNKKDVQAIYGNLSNRYKGTIWGQSIKKYLTDKFKNISLPDALTGEYTPIIKDSTRYTIIIFSASWCHPCHKQLSIQKVIYKKLKNKVDFVTVSLDEETTIKQWQGLIKKEKLPWRSLLAWKDVAGVREMYYVPYIPHCILVFPDKNYLRLNLWEQEDRNKLYYYVDK